MNQAVPGGGCEQPLAVALAVLEAEHLGVVRLEAAHLAHAVQVVNAHISGAVTRRQMRAVARYSYAPGEMNNIN